MSRSSNSSAAASAVETQIKPGGGLLLLLEAMADCEEQRPHAEIYGKLERVLLDSIEYGDPETGQSRALDPTPEQLAAIRQILEAPAMEEVRQC